MKNRGTQAGLTLIELLVGLVVSSIVLGGAFSLWKTHEVEGFRLKKKIELRNVMTLSSKRIQRSVTLAGIGLGSADNKLARSAATGSDTLLIYTNVNGTNTALMSNITPGGGVIVQVADPSLFQTVSYLAVSNAKRGEIRRIVRINGSSIEVDAAFTYTLNTDSALVYPCVLERYYTDQANNALMYETNGDARVVAQDVKDFQVDFRDNTGAATNVSGQVSSVVFSFTGIYPAEAGAQNSIVFSSTAIPRNSL